MDGGLNSQERMLPVAWWFCSTTCSGPDRCWINEFEVAQIVRSPPQKKEKRKEKHADREQDGVCAGQGEHKYTFNFPGRFSRAGPVPEGCASFPNVSLDGAETQFVWGLSRPVWAPLDGEEP